MTSIHEEVNRTLTENLEKEQEERLEKYIESVSKMGRIVVRIMEQHRDALEEAGFSGEVTSEALTLVHAVAFQQLTTPRYPTILDSIMSMRTAPDDTE